jgi:hypothetical protein
MAFNDLFQKLFAEIQAQQAVEQIPRTAETEAQYRALRQDLNARGIHYGAADRELAKLGYNADEWNPHQSGGFSKIAGGIGDVVGNVAPIASIIPGVGSGIAALATAGGKALGKLNDPGGLGGTKLFKDIALPAGLTYAGGKAIDKMGGFGKIAGGLGDGDGKFGIGDIVSGAGKILTGGDGLDLGDLGKIAGIVGAGAGVVSGVKAAKQSGKDSQRARDLVEQAIARATEMANTQRAEYGKGEAMRSTFRDAALNYGDASNPFAKAGGFSKAAGRVA